MPPRPTGFFTITEALRFLASVLDVPPAFLDGNTADGPPSTRLVRDAVRGRTSEEHITRVKEALATAIGLGLRSDSDGDPNRLTDRDEMLLTSLLEALAVYWALLHAVRLPPGLDRRDVVHLLAKHEFVPRLAVTLSDAASAHFAGALATPPPSWMSFPSRAPRGKRQPLNRVFHRLRELVGARNWASFCRTIGHPNRHPWPGLEQMSDWRHARQLPSRDACTALAGQIAPHATHGFPPPEDIRSPAAFEAARRYLRRRPESDTALAGALQLSEEAVRVARTEGDAAALPEEDRHFLIRRLVHRWGILTEEQVRSELLSAVYAERLIAAAWEALGGPTTLELARLFTNVYNAFQATFEGFRLMYHAEGVTDFGAQCVRFREDGPTAFRLAVSHPDSPVSRDVAPYYWAILGVLQPPDDLLAAMIETEAWAGCQSPSTEALEALNEAWHTAGSGAPAGEAEAALARVRTYPVAAGVEADTIALMEARLAVERGAFTDAVGAYERALHLTEGRGGRLSTEDPRRRVERIGEEYLGLLGYLIMERGEHRKREYRDLHRRLVLLDAVPPYESVDAAIAESVGAYGRLWLS